MSSNSHWRINKDFVAAYSWFPAIIMTNLIDKWIMFGFPEWFYIKVEDMEADIKLSDYQQREAIKVLTDNNFVEVKNFGMPMKRHFKINELQLLNFFRTSSQKTGELVPEKFENYFSKNSPTLYNNKILEQKEEKKKESLPPSKSSNAGANLSAMKQNIGKILKKHIENYDQLVAPIDMSNREIWDAFSEYWVIGQQREFVKTNFKGLCASFEAWVDLRDADDLKSGQSESGIGKTADFHYLLTRVTKIGKFTPDVNQRLKMNKMLEDNSLTTETIDHICTRFQNSSSMGFDAFMIIAENVIREEKIFGLQQ